MWFCSLSWLGRGKTKRLANRSFLGEFLQLPLFRYELLIGHVNIACMHVIQRSYVVYSVVSSGSMCPCAC